MWQEAAGLEEYGLAIRFYPSYTEIACLPPTPLRGELGDGDVFKGHLKRFSYLGVFFAAIASAAQKLSPQAVALCVT